MKTINLTRGQVALVDDEDFEYLNTFKWRTIASGNIFYASRTVTIDGKRINILMHGVIMGGKGIDHIDHNGLNNQKSNLRLCTRSENMMNRRKGVNTSSIYKGVSFHKGHKKWGASIGINNKKISLGYFDTEAEAALAYNTKAIALFCEFANLNNIN